MAFGEDDDLMADVAAAVRGEDGGAPETPVAEAQAAPAPNEAGAQAPNTPPRDASGKFAPRGSETQQPAAPPPAAATPAQDVDAVRPPASWSAAAKAQFNALPPIIQQEVLKREKDVDSGRAQWETKAQVANQLDEIFSPYREQLAMNGLTPLQLTKQLAAAHAWLMRDPQGAITHLARQYGAQAPQIGQQAPGQQQPQAQLHPALAPFMQELQALKQTVTQQSQAQADAQRERMSHDIQQFAADPKNLYFENVRGDMAALLNAGRATTLADAYEMAIWSSPEIRPLLLQQQAAQAQTAAAASAKVSKAKSAGGSVTGSPTPGASPAQQSNPNASVEDDVRAAFANASSRA